MENFEISASPLSGVCSSSELHGIEWGMNQFDLRLHPISYDSRHPPRIYYWSEYGELNPGLNFGLYLHMTSSSLGGFHASLSQMFTVRNLLSRKAEQGHQDDQNRETVLWA